jgi:hypothetical protein
MRKPALWLALGLLCLSACFVFYRIVRLGSPLIPTAPGQTWELSLNVHVKSGGGETRVALGLPAEIPNRMVVEEKISPGAQSVNIFREGPNRIGVWSFPGGHQDELISYRTLIHLRARSGEKERAPDMGSYPPQVGPEEQGLAVRLVSGWKRLSPPMRIKAIAATASGKWVDPPPPNAEIQAWLKVKEKLGKGVALLSLFRAAGLPARSAEGLRLLNSVVSVPFPWIEVWDGQRWENLHPGSGEFFGRDAELLPLSYGGAEALRVFGGELREVRYAVTRQIVSHWSLYYERARRSEKFLDRWSLFHLPEEFQRTFRILLLVPLGALLISVLKNLVGFPAFGIFMPVLMALSFRNTGLYYGLAIFFGVLLVGYGVRRVLEKLRLLLVPRMSVILTLVIASFTVLALIGSKYGLREFMAVGLLPFVILTMVIERFFVLIEEAGAREGIRTALGSAAVAVITYWIVSWEPLQLTFFVYPEFMAVVVALQILVGQYSGLRLSELFRFRRIVGS